MKSYIGKDIQLIYIDRNKNVSIRKVRVLVAGEQRFLAYCYEAKAVRTFSKKGIVDVEPLKQRPIAFLKQQSEEPLKQQPIA